MRSAPSFPLWERGLKSALGSSPCPPLSSFPLWERGLKSLSFQIPHCQACRSPCGNVDWNCIFLAHWEARYGRSPCGNVDWNSCPPPESIFPLLVVPLVGTWIEILLWMLQIHMTHGRSPCGNVDWNVNHTLRCSCTVRRSPCGNVDWNDVSKSRYAIAVVVPLVGTWIEILY